MPSRPSAFCAALLVAPLLVAPSCAAAEVRRGPVVPLRLSVMNESVSLPDATRMFAALHPGLALGSELAYHRGARWTLYQSADLGFFHHHDIATSLFVITAIGARPRIAAGLFADVHLGVGALLRIETRPLFAVSDDGEFRRVPGALPRFVAVGGVGLGYAVGTVAPFVGYRVMIEAPFLQGYSAVLPHQLVEVGVRVELRP